MKKIISIIVFITFLLIAVSESFACSAFCQGDSTYLIAAKNYDYGFGSGLIIVNKRGMAKAAFTNDKPANWVSRYGSITFNQYGRELPNGGMNEAGLVIEVLWLNNTQYPDPDNRPALNTLQWIQYQLDNNATVEQVIASDSVVRISETGSVQVHFFTCDSTGSAAVIEFIDGKMTYHTGDDMPVKGITNNTYNDSYKYLKRYQGYGGKQPIGNRDTTSEVFSRAASLDRFLHLADRSDNYAASNDKDPIDYAFQTLRLVKSGDRTMWSIVYDIRHRIIYYQSNLNPLRKSVNFNAFDFACSSPVMVLDINRGGRGDVTADFVEYTEAMNYDIIRTAIENTAFLRGTGDDFIRAAAAYPSSLRCVR
jgi:penicillin V acylase-like amidase (Ntn superfamily)